MPMMIEHNLKTCPFCGGAISLVAACQTPDERRVHMRCHSCGMEFIHAQIFVYFAGVRVAVGASFEEVWGWRADHDHA